jgi:hypothetical protein
MPFSKRAYKAWRSRNQSRFQKPLSHTPGSGEDHKEISPPFSSSPIDVIPRQTEAELSLLSAGSPLSNHARAQNGLPPPGGRTKAVAQHVRRVSSRPYDQCPDDCPSKKFCDPSSCAVESVREANAIADRLRRAS